MFKRKSGCGKNKAESYLQKLAFFAVFLLTAAAAVTVTMFVVMMLMMMLVAAAMAFLTAAICFVFWHIF